MSEMVERVAEAIWQAESVRADRGPRRVTWDEAGPPTWDKYRPLARAAIEAMREPTEAMVHAGSIAMSGKLVEGSAKYKTLETGFKAMIDEALK